MERISNRVSSTHNQDGAILLDISQGQMFNVNVVGSRIIELLKNGSTQSAITGQISREFGIGLERAENDVQQFLYTLKKHHLVENREAECGSLSRNQGHRIDGTLRLGAPSREGVRERWDFNCSPGLGGRANETRTFSFLVLKAYLQLIRFDLYLTRGNFAVLYDKVRDSPLRKATPAANAVECICSAVDVACIWYWKEALCLQRSAATSCLLKSHGIFAQMVIGTQQMPFKAHAWVEVDGRVVNDKPHVQEIYTVLNRCH